MTSEIQAIDKYVTTHSVSTNTIRNAYSARVSIPPIFKKDPVAVFPFQWRTPLRSTSPYWSSMSSFILHRLKLTLRIEGWFEGLSSEFLKTRAARLLVLAGTDRLDDELMIGQMQGKFQLVVVPGVGHILQEVCTILFGYHISPLRVS
jgi:protein phosphatase methylesterase 1